MWYIVGAVVVIAVLALWYFSSMKSQTEGTPSTAETAQTVPLSSGDTTADISSDINQLPDDSAGLNQEQAASIQAVSGF